jgi:hypothetical protein
MRTELTEEQKQEFRRKQEELTEKLRQVKPKVDMEIIKPKPKQKKNYDPYKYRRKPAMLQHIEAQQRRD